MYRVLLGIGDDEARAREQAAFVSGLPDAPSSVEAILLHSFVDNPAGASITQLAAVRRASDRLDDAGIEYTYVETSGDPVAEILEAAEAHDVDVICLSGRKRTPTGKAVFGSVTQGVMLDSERPVVTVQPRSEE